MKPKFLTKEELLAVLDDMRRRIEANDSFEGYLNYLLPNEEDDPHGFRVEARWRVGNSQGQGGMRVVYE